MDWIGTVVYIVRFCSYDMYIVYLYLRPPIIIGVVCCLFILLLYFIILYYRVLLFSKHIMVMRIVIKIRDDYEKDNAFD